MNVAIIDSNVINMIQPGAFLEYLEEYPNLKVVISRTAREQSSRTFGNLGDPCEDAPVPVITNNRNRKTNDPGNIVAPTPGMKAAREMRNSSNAKPGNDEADREIIGSAIDLYEQLSTNLDYENFYLISADRGCCKSAYRYFKSQNIPIEVLQAWQLKARAIVNVRKVHEVFPL